MITDIQSVLPRHVVLRGMAWNLLPTYVKLAFTYVYNQETKLLAVYNVCEMRCRFCSHCEHMLLLLCH